MFRISGYNEKERFNYIKGAIDRYENGDFISLNRDRKEIQKVKDSKGGGPAT